MNMKAVRIHRFGNSGVLKYEDAPRPAIAPDEVLVKVFACGVNPYDWKIREGLTEQMLPHKLPLIPGWDVAGTVAEKGSMVRRFGEGDAVICRPDPRFNGGYAEYVAVKAHELAPAPESIPLDNCAGIPLASQAAWVALFEAGELKKGQKVLIHGASGGLGTFAVQFAKLAGAHVIGTASSKNFGLVASLGADEIIDHVTDDFTKKVKGVDLVFDTIGGDTQARSFGIIKKGGVLVSSVGADEKAAASHGVSGRSFILSSNGARLEGISRLVDREEVEVIVQKIFPLAEAKAAQDLSQTGHAAGKIILKI